MMGEDAFARRLGRVGIVGAGQVGTTVGMALRGAQGVDGVLLHDRDPAVAAESLARGAGDRTAGPDEVLAADVVVLALLVPQLPPFIGEHAERFRPGSLVIDTGSTKRSIVAAMRALPASVHAVGGHPIAGTEGAGPAGARRGILRGAAFVLTPVREDPEALARGRALAEAVGARPVVVDAGTHDRVLARTSHLPHVLAAALALSAGRAGDPVEELASTGYQGVARLAGSDPAMVGGFLADNADEVRAALEEFGTALAEVAGALTGDPGDIGRVLAEARAAIESGQGRRDPVHQREAT